MQYSKRRNRHFPTLRFKIKVDNKCLLISTEKSEFQIPSMPMRSGRNNYLNIDRRQTINYELSTAKNWKNNWGFMKTLEVILYS